MEIQNFINSYFIKKIRFEADSKNMVELYSLNKESLDNGILHIDVLASYLKEIAKPKEELIADIDKKKYLSTEEYVQLSELIQDESEFINQLNIFIQ